MLKAPLPVLRSPLFLKLALGGLLLTSSLGTQLVRASTPTQPVDLSELQQTATSAPVPPLAVIQDPTLFLPQASQPLSQLILRLSERRLYGYRGDREVVRYPVAVGRDQWETPTGEFIIFQRQAHPAWEHPFTGEVIPPGPDNPLGARWLGFWTDGTNAIGFHGTPHEHLIGEAVSHGCVRLRNADVIELYDRVELGTPVMVLP